MLQLLMLKRRPALGIESLLCVSGKRQPQPCVTMVAEAQAIGVSKPTKDCTPQTELGGRVHTHMRADSKHDILSIETCMVPVTPGLASVRRTIHRSRSAGCNKHMFRVFLERPIILEGVNYRT